MKEGKLKIGRSRLVIYIIFGLAIAVIIYYFVINQKSNSNRNIVNQPSVVSTNTSQSTSQSITTVSIENFQFNPSLVTIKKGTSVFWVNRDSTNHTVVSGTGSELSSNILGQGASFTHVFDKVGTFSYHCGIHRSMQGNIVVID